MGKKNSIYKISDYNKKVIADLQDFLIYKKATSLDYGSRLLEPFVVVDMESHDNEKNILVKFENYNVKPTEHYWVNKKEFHDFVAGDKRLGITLKIDRHFIDDGHIVFELRLTSNGLKGNSVNDVAKLKNLLIEYSNGNLYKVFDVQIKINQGTTIDNIVRLLVTEVESAGQFINKQVVFKDNMEATKGPGMTIVLSGPNTQEEFVKKNDAIKALKLERKNTIKEVSLWLQSLAEQNVANAEELKIKFTEKFN